MKEKENKTVVHEESQVFTKLVDKHYSPLMIRKYTHWGFPIYVGMITDNDLSDFDEVVTRFVKSKLQVGWVNNIQALRDFAGEMTEFLNKYYNRSEGVAVVFYVDKMFISSLHGDFMNHTACRIEFYGLLNMSTGV